MPSAFWLLDAKGQRRLDYSVSATRRDSSIESRRRCIDMNAQLLHEQNCAAAISLLLKRYSVLRLCNARLIKRTQRGAPVTTPHPKLRAAMETLAHHLERHQYQLSGEVLRQELRTMQQRMQRYFQVQPHDAGNDARSPDPQTCDGGQG